MVRGAFLDDEQVHQTLDDLNALSNLLFDMDYYPLVGIEILEGDNHYNPGDADYPKHCKEALEKKEELYKKSIVFERILDNLTDEEIEQRRDDYDGYTDNPWKVGNGLPMQPYEDYTIYNSALLRVQIAELIAISNTKHTTKADRLYYSLLADTHTALYAYFNDHGPLSDKELGTRKNSHSDDTDNTQDDDDSDDDIVMLDETEPDLGSMFEYGGHRTMDDVLYPEPENAWFFGNLPNTAHNLDGMRFDHTPSYPMDPYCAFLKKVLPQPCQKQTVAEVTLRLMKEEPALLSVVFPALMAFFLGSYEHCTFRPGFHSRHRFHRMFLLPVDDIYIYCRVVIKENPKVVEMAFWEYMYYMLSLNAPMEKFIRRTYAWNWMSFLNVSICDAMRNEFEICETIARGSGRRFADRLGTSIADAYVIKKYRAVEDNAGKYIWDLIRETNKKGLMNMLPFKYINPSMTNQLKEDIKQAMRVVLRSPELIKEINMSLPLCPMTNERYNADDFFFEERTVVEGRDGRCTEQTVIYFTEFEGVHVPLYNMWLDYKQREKIAGWIVNIGPIGAHTNEYEKKLGTRLKPRIKEFIRHTLIFYSMIKQAVLSYHVKQRGEMQVDPEYYGFRHTPKRMSERSYRTICYLMKNWPGEVFPDPKLGFACGLTIRGVQHLHNLLFAFLDGETKTPMKKIITKIKMDDRYYETCDFEIICNMFFRFKLRADFRLTELPLEVRLAQMKALERRYQGLGNIKGYQTVLGVCLLCRNIKQALYGCENCKLTVDGEPLVVVQTQEEKGTIGTCILLDENENRVKITCSHRKNKTDGAKKVVSEVGTASALDPTAEKKEKTLCRQAANNVGQHNITCATEEIIWLPTVGYMVDMVTKQLIRCCGCGHMTKYVEKNQQQGLPMCEVCMHASSTGARVCCACNTCESDGSRLFAYNVIDNIANSSSNVLRDDPVYLCLKHRNNVNASVKSSGLSPLFLSELMARAKEDQESVLL